MPVHKTVVRLPVQTSLTQITILLGSVKCVVASKQWVTAFKDYKGNCRHCDTLASVPSELISVRPVLLKITKVTAGTVIH